VKEVKDDVLLLFSSILWKRRMVALGFGNDDHLSHLEWLKGRWKARGKRLRNK